MYDLVMNFKIDENLRMATIAELLNIIRKWNRTRVSLFEETFLQSTTKINTTSFCSRLKIVAQTQKAIGFTSTEIRRKSFGKVVGKMFLSNDCMKLANFLLI